MADSDLIYYELLVPYVVGGVMLGVPGEIKTLDQWTVTLGITEANFIELLNTFYWWREVPAPNSTRRTFVDSAITVLSTPPGSPSKWARYLVGTAPIGVFAGQEGNIATYYGPQAPQQWYFDVTLDGDALILQDETGILRKKEGGTWVSYPLGGGHAPVTVVGENYLSLSGQQITANKIGVDNIQATGTPSSSTTLHGDGVWRTPSGGGGGGSGDPSVAFCVDQNGGNTVTGDWTDITVEQNIKVDAPTFTKLDSSTIQVNTDGTYLLSGKVRMAKGVVNPYLQVRLMTKTGLAPYVYLNGSLSAAYTEGQFQDGQTAYTGQVVATLTAGMRVRMQAYAGTGTVTGTTLGGGSTLTIVRLTSPSAGGAETFLDLLDVAETSYIGSGGQFVRVRGAEDGLEFSPVAVGFGDITGSPNDNTALASALASAESNANAYADAALATHVAASDPHGDRAYSDGQLSAHVGASDPHGDRAYADSNKLDKSANLGDVGNPSVAFANIKQAATTTVTGVVELATNGETAAGVVVQGNDNRLALASTALQAPPPLDQVLNAGAQTLGHNIVVNGNDFIAMAADIGGGGSVLRGPTSTGSVFDIRLPAENGTLLVDADIGNSVQAYDSDLDAIAALSPSNDDVIQRKAGVWTNRTPAQYKADLGLTNAVTNAGSSTDNAIARFDLATGKIIQNSLVIVNDDGSMVFPSVAGPTYQAGKMVYDSDNDCFTSYNSNSSVSLQNGQEMWIRVRNVTGSTINNGQAVYINGSNSGLPTIALAQANSSTTTVVAGLATHNIANNATGFITCIGLVRDIDTSALSIGNLFLSATTPGALTSTAPSAPDFRYRVGFVTNVNATSGSIHVTPTTAMLANGTANQVLGMNAGATAQEWKTVSAGSTRLTVTHGINTMTLDTPIGSSVTATYSSGSLASTTTALATVPTTALALTAGTWDVCYHITYDTAAGGTGALFSLGGATLTASFVSGIVSYDSSVTDRGNGHFMAFDGGVPATSTRVLTGNNAVLWGKLLVTSPGNVSLRWATEIAASAITITAVSMYAFRVG